MKFTRDICRLLGLGRDGSGEEEMEAQDGAPDPADRTKGQGSPQAALNNEEGLGDKERARRRAERRRARRKRQRERKKLEREERTEDAPEQEEEKEAAGEAASESEEEEEEEEEEEQWTAVRHRNPCSPESAPAPVTSRNELHLQPPGGTSEEEPEWDVSSAFVANAASHIKPRGPRGRATQVARENQENEAGGGQGDKTEETKRRGETLTEQGIQMFGEGRYSQAVDMFTQAIYCDPKDHRFFANRSHCYWCLERYSSALGDAQRSIELAPDWPKGYFRKGCALMGLKRYSEAEKAMQQVLALDQHIKEACSTLLTCRILQLREMGFDEEQSKALLEKFDTVQAVLTSSEAKDLKHTPLQDHSGSCRSLWVGNITLEVMEKDLWDLFEMFGEVESVRVLHERFCAFVNFRNANTAAKALQQLQGAELGGTRLVMRYPDRWIQGTPASLPRTNPGLSSDSSSGSRPRAHANGDECFFWRTTGCYYGDRCRYKHSPDQQGRSKKPWQL